MSLCFSGVKEYTLHLAVEATNTVCCEKLLSFCFLERLELSFLSCLCCLHVVYATALCSTTQEKKPKPAAEPSATVRQHFANKLDFLRVLKAEIARQVQLEN